MNKSIVVEDIRQKNDKKMLALIFFFFSSEPFKND